MGRKAGFKLSDEHRAKLKGKAGRKKLKQPGDPVAYHSPSPRVRSALELMVAGNLDVGTAAAAVGMKRESLILAMRRPPTMNLYNFLVENLRRGNKHRAMHSVLGLMDNSENDMAKLQAAKVILDPGMDAAAEGIARAQQQHPGITIVIQSNPEPREVAGITIDALAAPPHRAILPSVD